MADQRIYIHQLPLFDIENDTGYIPVNNLTTNSVGKLNTDTITKKN